MKKNLKYILISIISIFFICTPQVSADSQIKDRIFIKIDGKQVKKLYDNTISGNTNIIGAEAGRIILAIDGKEYVGYCIDFGVYIGIGSAQTQSLQAYFEKALDSETAKKLVNKLALYINFGYGSEGRTSDKYYLATQQLIWEEISATGFYASDYYYNFANGALTSKLRIANFRWTNDNGTSTIDLSSEISAIQNSVRNYYVTPSFCSSQNRIEIEVGETAEYTDTNNVLGSYLVSCGSGLTCETEGNKLTVTAIDDKEASSNDIIFTKNSTVTENYVYRNGQTQGVIANNGILEAVTCQFGIDTYKNEKTADAKIIYIITIGIFCGVMAYIAYYTKKSLDDLK